MNIVKFRRLKSGLSQKQLAKKCGFTQGYISKLENDQICPSAKNIKIIAKKLDMCSIPIYAYFYEENKCTFFIDDCFYSNHSFCNKKST